jgi:hypothetical protein
MSATRTLIRTDLPNERSQSADLGLGTLSEELSTWSCADDDDGWQMERVSLNVTQRQVKAQGYQNQRLAVSLRTRVQHV